MKFIPRQWVPDSAATQPGLPLEAIVQVAGLYRNDPQFPIEFDIDDLALLAKFIVFVDPADEDETWKRIAAGGRLGASWLLHELEEMRTELLRRVDIFDVRQRTSAWKSAHGHALIVEHRYLFQWAQEMRYNIKELGSLIRFNPSVPEAQALLDFDLAVRQDYSLSYRDEDEPTVQRFFERLKKQAP